MLAGYVRVWLSMPEAIDHVMRVAGCGPQEARDALVQAILDEEIRSRFGDNGLQGIKAFLWENARRWAPYSGLGARMPNRVKIMGDAAYLRPFFDPPPDPELLPDRLRPVEVRREDLERLWPPPRAAIKPRDSRMQSKTSIANAGAGDPDARKGSEFLPTPRPLPRSGIRTTLEEKAEDACRKWIAQLTERPPNKKTAFEMARDAVKPIGQLSYKAFDRAWATEAPSAWKKGGRRKTKS
jgi:hypothetical protein